MTHSFPARRSSDLENPAAKPFGENPERGERQQIGWRRKMRLAPRFHHPRTPRRPCRINRQIERQQNDRDPPQPRGPRCLKGEGGREAVEAEREMAEPEMGRPSCRERVWQKVEN